MKLECMIGVVLVGVATAAPIVETRPDNITANKERKAQITSSITMATNAVEQAKRAGKAGKDAAAANSVPVLRDQVAALAVAVSNLSVIASQQAELLKVMSR